MSKKRSLMHSSSINSSYDEDQDQQEILQNYGIHHVGGRVVHIDIEMIKDSKKQVKKKKKKGYQSNSVDRGLKDKSGDKSTRMSKGRQPRKNAFNIQENNESSRRDLDKVITL